jgi:alpha-tubulin suppressor-like RCC1 family protein
MRSTCAVVLVTITALVAGPLAGTSQAAPLGAATAISTATDHACALLSDRTVTCWGQNDQGQLGDGTRIPRLAPVAVRGLSGVIDVSAGFGYTCAVVDGGAGSGPVKCWGTEEGLTNGRNTYGLVPASVSGINDAVAVTAGDAVACALLSDHTVACWGDNSQGELGDGTRASSSTPVVVPGLSGVQAINAGEGSVCVVMQAGGTVECWGSAGYVAPDEPDDTLTPTQVPRLTGAVSVSASPYNSCAVLQNGTVECWSLDAHPFVPKVVPGLSGVKAYAFSVDGQQTEHSCALFADGTVKCNSPNPYAGQIGNGTTKPNGNKLVTVSGLRQVTMISAADFYTCAVRSTGSVECWGGNTDGVLGDGTAINSSRPVTVSRSAPVPVFGHAFFRSVGFGHAHPSYISFGGADELFKMWDIRWTHWGDQHAVGLGKGWLLAPGKPVSGGHLERQEIVAFDLGICKGKLAPLKMKWFFPGHGERFSNSPVNQICEL